MSIIAGSAPSPELTRANALIIAGCKEIQRLLEPQDGRVSPVNMECSLHLMEQALKANKAMEQADYAEVERLLDWCKPKMIMRKQFKPAPVRVVPLRLQPL